MDAGISIRHVQHATTWRTRALTGDREYSFLAWNNWNSMDDREEKYAVCPTTHQSPQRYFKLDRSVAVQAHLAALQLGLPERFASNNFLDRCRRPHHFKDADLII